MERKRTGGKDQLMERKRPWWDAEKKHPHWSSSRSYRGTGRIASDVLCGAGVVIAWQLFWPVVQWSVSTGTRVYGNGQQQPHILYIHDSSTTLRTSAMRIFVMGLHSLWFLECDWTSRNGLLTWPVLYVTWLLGVCCAASFILHWTFHFL